MLIIVKKNKCGKLAENEALSIKELNKIVKSFKRS